MFSLLKIPEILREIFILGQKLFHAMKSDFILIKFDI